MKPNRWVIFAICAGLALIVWVVFGQTLRHEFVNYDDGQYVYKNPQVTGGLTGERIVWAFTRTYAANWHPLTWLSHMLDCELFGLRAGGHHLTNVLLHGATTILLFLVFAQMTTTMWRSAFVAALFAIHPLRVESVAWVAERKDLLSGLFFVLTLGAYARYARTPSARSYLLVLLLFALGLMSKPMLVTVPFVLLLLDYWPLRRNQTLYRLAVEKVPLLLLAIASCVITLLAQTTAIRPLADLSIPLRLGNAIISTGTYIAQMFWPVGLAPFYPIEPGKIVFARVLLLLGVLVAISTLVVSLRARRYLVTGWLWYLVMLVPVIGIVQVGQQAHADRYTYLPQIGLAVALTWAAADLIGRWRNSRFVLGSAAALIIGTLAFAAHKQTSYWRDSETLWNHALAVTSNNFVAEEDLGEALYRKGRLDEAIGHLQKALAMKPGQPSIHSTLGVIFLEMGQAAESLSHLETAISLGPNDSDAHYNLANTLMALGRAQEAITHYRRALEGNPLDAEAMNNMAWLLATTGDTHARDGAKAVQFAERADALTHQRNARIGATLAAAYAEAGRFEEAIRTGHRALTLATNEGDSGLAELIRGHISMYESRSPIRTL